MIRRPPISTPFPCTTLFRSRRRVAGLQPGRDRHEEAGRAEAALQGVALAEGLLHRVQHLPAGEALDGLHRRAVRSEEHTSELQSRQYLVCRLLLEKKISINIRSYLLVYYRIIRCDATSPRLLPDHRKEY